MPLPPAALAQLPSPPTGTEGLRRHRLTSARTHLVVSLDGQGQRRAAIHPPLARHPDPT